MGLDQRHATVGQGAPGIQPALWEARDLAERLGDLYALDVVQRSPWGVTQGAAAARSVALEMLRGMPRASVLGEDVVWWGEGSSGGFASHRCLCSARHDTETALGPPTGRTVQYRVIADSFLREGQICDQWLLRDTGGLLRQIGQTPEAWVAARLKAGASPDVLTPVTDRYGPYEGQGTDDSWGMQLADLLARIMDAEFSAIPAEYDPACHLVHPGGRQTHGHRAADRFWLALRAAFPAAIFVVHHAMGREDPMMPPRAAVRWSLTGHHEGWGAFGAPTRRPVHVMGITHAEFGPRGLRREWTLYDETAIWAQLLGTAD